MNSSGSCAPSTDIENQGSSRISSKSKFQYQRTASVHSSGLSGVLSVLAQATGGTEAVNGARSVTNSKMTDSERSRADANVQIADRIEKEMSKYFGRGEQSRMNEELEHVVINALRRAKGNENATFQSEEQRTAMGEVWKSQQDVAVLLSTGGGKQQLHWVPPYSRKTLPFGFPLFARCAKAARIGLRI